MSTTISETFQRQDHFSTGLDKKETVGKGLLQDPVSTRFGY